MAVKKIIGMLILAFGCVNGAGLFFYPAASAQDDEPQSFGAIAIEKQYYQKTKSYFSDESIIEQVNSDTSLSSDEKKKRIQEYRAQAAEMMKQVNESLDQEVREGKMSQQARDNFDTPLSPQEEKQIEDESVRWVKENEAKAHRGQAGNVSQEGLVEGEPGQAASESDTSAQDQVNTVKPFTPEELSAQKDHKAKENLQMLAHVCELFAEQNQGRYPARFEDANGYYPAAVWENTCGKEVEGFSFSCNFVKDGYEFTATPLTGSDAGTHTWVIKTGGVFVDPGKF